MYKSMSASHSSLSRVPMSHFRLAVGVEGSYTDLYPCTDHRQQTGDGRWRDWPSLDSLVATAECVITLGVPMTPAQAPEQTIKKKSELFPQFSQ